MGAWQRTEARVVEMLQAYRDEPEKPVKDLTTWLERQKFILLESIIWATIERKPALTATEEWFWKMEYRHLKLTELEQEFRDIYEADGIEYAVEQPIGSPNAIPDTTVELTNTENPTGGADPTIEIQGSSTAINQYIESTQPESQLIDEEEACAGVGESTIGALPVPLQAMASLYVQTARLAPESGEEIMDQKAACTFETFDDVIGDYAFPARRVLPTDRPPPNSGHPFEVRKDRASPKSTEDLIDETHACVLEAVLGEYAFPTLLFVPTDRPPPEPGEAANSSTATIKLKACGSQAAGYGGRRIRVSERGDDEVRWSVDAPCFVGGM
jgi:hypothetical protein